MLPPKASAFSDKEIFPRNADDVAEARLSSPSQKPDREWKPARGCKIAFRDVKSVFGGKKKSSFHILSRKLSALDLIAFFEERKESSN
jgi:hypothetical protein